MFIMSRCRRTFRYAWMLATRKRDELIDAGEREALDEMAERRANFRTACSRRLQMKLTGTSTSACESPAIIIVSRILTRILAALAFGLVVLAVPASASGKVKKEPGFVYIASFNIYRFGAIEKRYVEITGDSGLQELDDQIPTRISNLARVLAVGDFDIVAIQEVQDGAAGHAAMSDLIRALRDQHQLVYDYILSEYIGRGYGLCEAMAFLFKPETVRPEPIGASGRYSARVDIAGRDLVRTQWEAGHFDFTMYAAHLAYGNLEDRRKGYQAIATIFDQPSDWSEDPDIIVLGDFNRLGKISQTCARGDAGCKAPPPIKELVYDPLSPNFQAPNITAFDPAFSRCPEVENVDQCTKGDTVLPVDDPQMLSTTVGDNTYAYDTIMFSRDASEEFPKGLHEAEYDVDFGIIHFDYRGGIGHQPGAESLNHDEIKKAYSDHRPVWIRFRTNDALHADD